MRLSIKWTHNGEKCPFACLISEKNLDLNESLRYNFTSELNFDANRLNCGLYTRFEFNSNYAGLGLGQKAAPKTSRVLPAKRNSLCNVTSRNAWGQSRKTPEDSKWMF